MLYFKALLCPQPALHWLYSRVEWYTVALLFNIRKPAHCCRSGIFFISSIPKIGRARTAHVGQFLFIFTNHGEPTNYFFLQIFSFYFKAKLPKRKFKIKMCFELSLQMGKIVVDLVKYKILLLSSPLLQNWAQLADCQWYVYCLASLVSMKIRADMIAFKGTVFLDV